MAVKRESEVATADAATRSRQRTRKRNDRDFVAIVYKLILVHDAKQRFGRMLNWHKLLMDDADDTPVPRKHTRKPRPRML